MREEIHGGKTLKEWQATYYDTQDELGTVAANRLFRHWGLKVRVRKGVKGLDRFDVKVSHKNG